MFTRTAALISSFSDLIEQMNVPVFLTVAFIWKIFPIRFITVLMLVPSAVVHLPDIFATFPYAEQTISSFPTDLISGDGFSTKNKFLIFS